MKALFRKIIRPILYYFYYLPFRNNIDKTRGGVPLKKGITAVVAMKNEEYTLPLCLESLIGFADQIVIIDNGSDDSSLKKAKAFKKEYGNNVEVDILEMPDALLGDCREAGLKETRYQWHLRWDADMVAHTEGENDMGSLRKKILKDNTPRAVQLPRINLFGDLHHTMGKVKDPGEPILIWFNKHVLYREFGKFDSIRVPFYFRQEKVDENYYFHCSGLKSDENLIHRFHYFTWREFYNEFDDKNRPAFIENFENFKTLRNQYLFGTNDHQSIKYRYIRQLVSQFRKFDSDKYGQYPAVLRKKINNNRIKERFEVIFKENEPFIRIDDEDQNMKEYIPTKADLEWDMSNFFKKLTSESVKNYI